VNSHILVLNYNGRHLLEECLPSVTAAAREATGCAVSVVDNGSQDGSLPWLRANCRDVGIFNCPNLGLVSFNQVVRDLNEPVVFLLNNDIKLAPGFVAPILEPFRQRDCLLAAPLCFGFDERSYEGMLTRVRLRRGLVQASTRYPGHERAFRSPGWTACAGPVLAVDREKFLALGGYDPLYLPGRLEDLDLCYRGWLAGWKACYVPEAVAYHKGFGSFHAAYGTVGCDLLALRNTLLFMWKNIRDTRHLAGHLAMLPVRLLHSCATAAWTPAERRFLFCRALFAALLRLPAALRRRWFKTIANGNCAVYPVAHGRTGGQLRQAEREFFTRFAWDAAGGLR
jgi:N-acetylglucosaminyl-diphospho-decaprenol L-rhamnosyltransferase